MLFNSFPFIFGFLPIVVAGFVVLRGRSSGLWWIGWLVAASLFFYGWWNPVYLPLLGGSVLFNYTVGRLMRSWELADRSPGARLLLLAAGVTADLGLLGYFKYANFFIDTSTNLGAAGFQLDEIILPLGISFFTLQQVAYLVDVYRGRAFESNVLRYALFVSFFPQLIAGPIVHHREIVPQFTRVPWRRLRFDLAVGLAIFTVGLVKKVVIADHIAVFASPVFEGAAAGAAPSFFEAWGGTFAYTFQIFFDFSGYSDMAVGLARMFGIRLPLNFAQPYKAASLIDFWRQWHMTLSRFLRDYVYIPLGGNRYSEARRYSAILLTMLMGGIWHGAGWTFVVWGALHGLLLVLNHLWRTHRRAPRGAPSSALQTGASRALTLIAVATLWVFFRAPTMSGAVAMLEGMAGLNGVVLPRRLESLSLPVVPWITYQSGLGNFTASGGLANGIAFLGALLLIVWFVPPTHEWMTRARPVLDPTGGRAVGRAWWQWRPSAAWAVFTAALGAVAVLLMVSRSSEFLYYQF